MTAASDMATDISVVIRRGSEILDKLSSVPKHWKYLKEYGRIWKN